MKSEIQMANAKFLNEFSKRAFVAIFCVGMFIVLAFFVTKWLGREIGDDVLKLGVDTMTTPFFGYITYQLGLKNSLNKNGYRIGKDGNVTKIDC